MARQRGESQKLNSYFEEDIPMKPKQRHGFIFLMMIVLILIMACGLGGSSSREVEQAIENIYAGPRGGTHGWRIDSVSDIDITGRGKVLPYEKDAGVEKIYCVNVEIDARDNTAGKYLYFSYLVGQIGNSWEVITVDGNGWDEHSCPGKYKGS
jgi:hypothetical protein